MFFFLIAIPSLCVFTPNSQYNRICYGNTVKNVMEEKSQKEASIRKKARSSTKRSDDHWMITGEQDLISAVLSGARIMTDHESPHYS